VATALANLLSESLASNSTLEDDIKHQEFLARTLGSIRVDEVTLPVLAEALSPDYDTDVRKSALMSLSMIAGQHFETKAQAKGHQPAEADEFGDALPEPLAEPTIDNEEILAQLRLSAQDEDPAVRHLTAFVLGLVSGPDAVQQLEVMLLDGDQMTRANAAVALARNGNAKGADTFIELLTEGAAPMDREAFQKLDPEQQQEALRVQNFEQPVILRNSLRAISSLWPRIPADQQAKLREVLPALAEDNAAADIRLQAGRLLERVQTAE
jgi:HEAT repeat protein